VTKATSWKNRIVGEGVQVASQFVANPANWRVHPQNQRDAMRGALNEVGWVQRVIVNRRTGYLIDGHERVWQALQNGDAEVPYVEVDLDEAEEAYVLATLDPIGAMAQASNEQLGALLAEVQSGDAGVLAMLAEVAERAELWADAAYGDTSTDRAGQGVASTWNQVKEAEMARVMLGDVEIRIDAGCINDTVAVLEAAFKADGTPYAVTMERVLRGGVGALADL
jgi:hypothetical protein